VYLLVNLYSLIAMDQNSAGCMYLKSKFPRTSDAKIKEGVFVGPQGRELIQDVKFENQLSEVEKATRKLIKKMSLPIFWQIIIQTTLMIWWMILYNPTALWGVL
jgi:hypothetical protein